MDPSPLKTRVVRFGVFEADLDQFVLTRAGLRIRLQEQPFQVLRMLVERPGELVTRSEIGQRLWSGDTFVEFDDGLNTAIRKLRTALGDESDNPRFIETVPRKGYRFIAPVSKESGESPPLSPGTETKIPLAPGPEFNVPIESQRKQAIRRGTLLATLAIGVLTGCLVVAFWRLKMPSATPHLVRITQLTRSGSVHTNQNLATDGVRLFYIERAAGEWQLKSMPVSGGPGRNVDVPLPRYDLQDLSLDGSQMLLRLLSSDADSLSIWIMSTVGGPVHRVGDIHADAATFSPDGRSITYSLGSHVYICDPDGRSSRQFVSVEGDALRLRWSPRGDLLRLSVNQQSLHTNTLWEVHADGTGLHQLLPGWNLPKWEWMLGWSHDARWFAFSAVRETGRDIWMLQHDPSSSRPDRGPFQLTAGPIEFDLPAFSADGKRIFAVGTQRRGELLRFNSKTGAFDPYLGKLSADQLGFSRDGKWVAYVTYPESVLWRSRTDGTDALKLNDTSMRIFAPRWSADGRQIVFIARTAGNRKWQAYIVSANGGVSHQVASGTDETTGAAWINGGKTLVLGSPQWDELRTLDLTSGNMAKLPGSTQLQGVSASPSGRYLISSSDDGAQTVLLDTKTGQRRLFPPGVNYPSWSTDERYIYVNRFDSSKPALFRLRASDLKEEKVFDLTAFPATGSWSTWSTVAPDGSILVLRDLGGTDVYAIDWQLE